MSSIAVPPSVKDVANMRAVSIHAKPHYSLRGWQAFRIGDAIFFGGTRDAKGDEYEEVWSGAIEFFDAARACGMDEVGVVWHIPVENVKCQDIEECTDEILWMLEEPLTASDVEPLTPSEEVLWKILNARG